MFCHQTFIQQFINDDSHTTDRAHRRIYWVHAEGPARRAASRAHRAVYEAAGRRVR